MDHVILSRVTGIYFETFRLRPGVLKNFKRLKVKNQHYPAIIEARGNEVEGVVVHGLTSNAVRRLDEFEDTDYERRNIVVGILNGQNVKAAVYVAGSGMMLDDIDWDFDTWYRHHRSSFLRRLRI